MFWLSCCLSTSGALAMIGSRVEFSMSVCCRVMVSGRMRMIATAVALIAWKRAKAAVCVTSMYQHSQCSRQPSARG
jgi:hypothetical protein